MITGDENIVQAQAVIQYRISDPKATYFMLMIQVNLIEALMKVNQMVKH